jgi:hypothetical protein
VQRDAINQARTAHNHPPIVADVVFIGGHIYRSRVVRDGYTFDDVIDQIASGMVPAAVVIQSPHMTAMENLEARSDRYGNLVRDRVVFECSARYPRPELYSVIPKGDRIKPKRLPME